MRKVYAVAVLAVLACVLAVTAAPGLARPRHHKPKAEPKVVAERSCKGILTPRWFNVATFESDKVVVHNSDEESSLCLFGLSPSQLDPNSPDYVPPDQQMDAGGGFTLTVWSRQAWAARRYGNILPPVALPPGVGSTKEVLHHLGTRAYLRILDNGGVIGVMQYQNATAEITAPVLSEAYRALEEVRDSL